MGKTAREVQNVCEVHGARHKFVECDEWGRTCVCGANEGEDLPE